MNNFLNYSNQFVRMNFWVEVMKYFAFSVDNELSKVPRNIFTFPSLFSSLFLWGNYKGSRIRAIDINFRKHWELHDVFILNKFKDFSLMFLALAFQTDCKETLKFKVLFLQAQNTFCSSFCSLNLLVLILKLHSQSRSTFCLQTSQALAASRRCLSPESWKMT